MLRLGVLAAFWSLPFDACKCVHIILSPASDGSRRLPLHIWTTCPRLQAEYFRLLLPDGLRYSATTSYNRWEYNRYHKTLPEFMHKHVLEHTYNAHPTLLA